MKAGMDLCEDLDLRISPLDKPLIRFQDVAHNVFPSIQIYTAQMVDIHS